MKKVSVIIPMYNAEPYICQCIQSVMSQTWENLEILVIDDGSTDQGLRICEELGSTDDRIRILTQRNRGVSAARNRGFSKRQGIIQNILAWRSGCSEALKMACSFSKPFSEALLRTSSSIS